MKDKMEDVRRHLVAMMEELGDKDEANPATVERAKAMSTVAQQYIAGVKCELDAYRLADEIDKLPAAIGQPNRLRLVG